MKQTGRIKLGIAPSFKRITRGVFWGTVILFLIGLTLLVISMIFNLNANFSGLIYTAFLTLIFGPVLLGGLYLFWNFIKGKGVGFGPPYRGAFVPSSAKNAKNPYVNVMYYGSRFLILTISLALIYYGLIVLLSIYSKLFGHGTLL